MKHLSMIILTLLVVGAGIGAPASLSVSASELAHVATSQKACKTVTKKVHGKTKKVRVCKTFTPKPTAAPQVGSLGGLWGTAVDARGNVYVAGRTVGGVIKLSPAGQVLATWLIPVDRATSEPADLTGIAVDTAGNLYLADAHNYRIVKLSPTGKVLAEWDTAHKAGRQRFGPGGVAVDSQGYIYTTNFDYSDVEKYSPSGQLVSSFGTECPQQPGSDSAALPCANATSIPSGQLNHPFGIELDGQGNIYVNDHRSSRVVKFSPVGEQLGAVGPTLPAPYPSMSLPEGVGVDSVGDVYVQASNPESVVKLAPSGTPLAEWQVPGHYYLGGDPGFDPQGNLYVTANTDDDPPSAMIVKLSPSLRVLAEWK